MRTLQEEKIKRLVKHVKSKAKPDDPVQFAACKYIVVEAIHYYLLALNGGKGEDWRVAGKTLFTSARESAHRAECFIELSEAVKTFSEYFKVISINNFKILPYSEEDKLHVRNMCLILGAALQGPEVMAEVDWCNHAKK